MTVVFGLTACADGKSITFEQLPVNAQTIITQNFAKEDILIITFDSEFLSKEYEVNFSDGKELKFNKIGELIKIDCKNEPVPTELIPAKVSEQIRNMYPTAFIKEWEFDDNRWKAELSNGLELIFNKKYVLVKTDN